MINFAYRNNFSGKFLSTVFENSTNFADKMRMLQNERVLWPQNLRYVILDNYQNWWIKSSHVFFSYIEVHVFSIHYYWKCIYCICRPEALTAGISLACSSLVFYLVCFYSVSRRGRSDQDKTFCSRWQSGSVSGMEGGFKLPRVNICQEIWCMRWRWEGRVRSGGNKNVQEKKEGDKTKPLRT